jgi:photosystem II stability/assembly factor-like uncharacterized protein
MNKKNFLICLLSLSNAAFIVSQSVWQATDSNLPEPLNIAYMHNAGGSTFWGIGLRGNFSNRIWEYDESNSYILRNTNNNGTWNKSRFPADSNIVGSLSAKSFTRAWLVTYDLAAKESKVWRTFNGGGSWQSLSISVTNNSYLNIIHMWNLSKGVILGDPVNGKFEIYKTTNGGSYWLKSDNTPTSEKGEIGLICISHNYGRSLYMPTTTGRMLYTKDMGETWDVSKTPLDFAEFISFKSEDEGMIALNDYSEYPFKTTISRTTDGGKTWSPTSSANFAFFDVKYIPNTNTLIGTTRERNDIGPFTTVVSQDDGLTWSTIETGTPVASFDFSEDGKSVGGMFKHDNDNTKMYRLNLPNDIPLKSIKK